MIPFMQLFKYSSASDKAKFWLGAIAAVLNGAVAPTYALVLATMFEVFNPYATNEENSELM